MKFDLVRPCEHCPFRTDCKKGWLGEARAAEIMNGLLSDATFACHETATEDEDGERVRNNKEEQHCAGAMILLEKLERPNQMMRICERIGCYDMRKLDMQSPVFSDPEDFVEHHKDERRRKPRGGSKRTASPRPRRRSKGDGPGTTGS